MNPAIPSVFVAGGASWDTIIDLDVFPNAQPATLFANHYHEAVGGPGSGKALNLERLGFNVILHVVLGQDEWGEKIQQRFQRTRVQLLTDIDPKGTERHTNLMDAEGRRISISTHAASPVPGIDPEHLASAIKHSDYIVLNIINYCRRLLPYAKAMNKPVWCDLQDYDGFNPYHNDFVTASDYLFMSDDHLENPRELMASLIDSGKKLVVCTHGKRGATALTADNEWFEVGPHPQVQLTDCNGAGDAFFSGYLFAHQRGLSVSDCLKVATKVASCCLGSTELVDEAITEADALAEI